MMAIIKVLAALVVLAILGATYWLVDELRSEATVPQLETTLADDPEGPAVEPGELAFERARELLATGEFEEARENLEFIAGVYPNSERAEEARRILGELNMDEFLSIDEMDGKELYKVQRGDAFLAIARNHETTLDCIMHLNGLQRLDQLYPGDELVILRLNLNVKIDVPRKRLSLMKEGRLLKAYPLVEARTRPGAAGVVHTTVKGKSGYVDGKSVKLTAEEYREAEKVLLLGVQGLQVRAWQKEEAGEEPRRGFFVKSADMEELAMLLRVGNEVEVRFTNP